MHSSARAVGLAAIVWLSTGSHLQDPATGGGRKLTSLDHSLYDRGAVIGMNRTTLAITEIVLACETAAERCNLRAKLAASDAEATALRDMAGNLLQEREVCLALAAKVDASVSEYESITCQRRSGQVARPNGFQDPELDAANKRIRAAIDEAKGDYDNLRQAVESWDLALPKWPKPVW
jgi:hypothetical protein